MGFRIDVAPDALTVSLSGWDRVMNLRRRVVIDPATVTRARVAERSSLEALIDHRALGIGTHDGQGRPNRRRVGTMIGRGVVGRQFWAVPASEPSTPLLVVDVHDQRVARAVLAVDDPHATAAAIERGAASRIVPGTIRDYP